MASREVVVFYTDGSRRHASRTTLSACTPGTQRARRAGRGSDPPKTAHRAKVMDHILAQLVC